MSSLPSKEKLSRIRHLARTDLYFLIRYVFNRKDFEHPWLYDRCKEVEREPYGYLDLWARDHRKSTIITYGHTIQEILASHGDNPLITDPVTVCILSHTRPIAKAFLRQIKREFEENQVLKECFPDILYENPKRDAPNWSEDSGLVVKRSGNPKEATVEAWGLVEGMPTGKHFNRLVYDDVVTRESVSSPEMIKKTTDAWELSLNLGSSGIEKIKMIGTRYHMNDTYRVIMDRQAAIPRIYPGTKEGTLDGTPVLLTKEQWTDKVRKMGTYTAGAQLLQNPVADKKQGFNRDWVRYYGSSTGEGMNKYLIVDPANVKSKKSDFTAMAVIGLAEDKNYYILDMVRDKLNLKERTRELFALHRKWKPDRVGYEKYGKDADIEHIEEKMDEVNYHFDIVALGGKVGKIDRIKALQPLFEDSRIYFPSVLHKTNWEGKTEDLVDQFLIEEFDPFPVPVHDDMLDCLARILEADLEADWPMIDEEKIDRYAGKRRTRRSGMCI